MQNRPTTTTQHAHGRQSIEKQKLATEFHFVPPNKHQTIIIMEMCVAEKKETLDTSDLSQLNEVTCEFGSNLVLSVQHVPMLVFSQVNVCARFSCAVFSPEFR